MLSLKKYFIKRREKQQNRAVFRLRRKTHKKIEAMKSKLLQERNKHLKKWLSATNAIKKLF